MDGHREEIEIGGLRQLCENFAWRRKIKALQGRVSNQREERGMYIANDIASDIETEYVSVILQAAGGFDKSSPDNEVHKAGNQHHSRGKKIFTPNKL